jgi:hypothetical protein
MQTPSILLRSSRLVYTGRAAADATGPHPPGWEKKLQCRRSTRAGTSSVIQWLSSGFMTRRRHSSGFPTMTTYSASVLCMFGVLFAGGDLNKLRCRVSRSSEGAGSPARGCLSCFAGIGMRPGWRPSLHGGRSRHGAKGREEATVIGGISHRGKFESQSRRTPSTPLSQGTRPMKTSPSSCTSRLPG